MIDALLSPVAALGLALILLFAWSCRPTVQLGMRAACAATLLMFGAMTSPWLANLLLGHLENEARTLRAACPSPPSGSVFVVLAGGLHPEVRSALDVTRLSGASLRRLIAAVQLARRTSGSTLILSGGAGGRWREADLMAHLARSLGMPPDRLIEDRTSRNTLQSARAIGKLIPVDSTGPIYVVTSAYHIRRAMLSFRGSGLKVCALPVNFEAVHYSPSQMLFPGLSPLRKMDLALHEYLGYLYYSWRLWLQSRGENPPRRAT